MAGHAVVGLGLGYAVGCIAVLYTDVVYYNVCRRTVVGYRAPFKFYFLAAVGVGFQFYLTPFGLASAQSVSGEELFPVAVVAARIHTQFVVGTSVRHVIEPEADVNTGHAVHVDVWSRHALRLSFGRKAVEVALCHSAVCVLRHNGEIFVGGEVVHQRCFREAPCHVCIVFVVLCCLCLPAFVAHRSVSKRLGEWQRGSLAYAHSGCAGSLGRFACGVDCAYFVRDRHFFFNIGRVYIFRRSYTLCHHLSGAV